MHHGVVVWSVDLNGLGWILWIWKWGGCEFQGRMQLDCVVSSSSRGSLLIIGVELVVYLT